MPQHYRYVIVGAGLAGASAVEGIREIDASSPILLIGADSELPYHRPPLTKDLWFGKKKVQQVFVHDRAFYRDRGVDLALGTQALGVEPQERIVIDSRGDRVRYEKLLLATGGAPRTLPIPGGASREINYFRTLDDYGRARAEAAPGHSALVIGGGFIGSEMAAALDTAGMDVTMLFPDATLCSRVLPTDLGEAVGDHYARKGIRMLSGDMALGIERRGARLVVATREGQQIEADTIVAGVGMGPETQLAKLAGLRVSDGIVVDDRLQTSDPHIYAAGDNAFFPYLALGRSMRIEHWDNALNQGKWAGRNMAGADEPYDYMPYFFSDLFEFGYEAVGDVNSRLQTLADWQEPHRTGVVYYLQKGVVRGAMMCNVWNKVDEARGLIRRGERMSTHDLHGAIAGR